MPALLAPPAALLAHLRVNKTLKMVPIWVSGPSGKEIKVNGIVDTGATCTWVDEGLAKKLGLDFGRSRTLPVQCFERTARMSTASIAFKLRGRDLPTYEIDFAQTFPKMTFSGPDVPITAWQKKYKHLQGLPLEDLRYADAKVLIGEDNEYLYNAVKKPVYGPDMKRDPILHFSRLGYIVSGHDDRFRDAGAHLMHSVWSCDPEPCDQALRHQMAQFHTTEEFGVRCNVKSMSRQEREAEKVLEARTRVVDGRIEVPMLWNPKKANLRIPDSYPVALSRLRSFEATLNKKGNEVFRQKFCDSITGDIGKEYIRKLDPEEAKSVMERERRFFLPIFAVFHPDKPDKLRRVYDAACQVAGTSLNDLLVPGPNLLNNIVGLVTRFRAGECAVSGDVEGMFSQVPVPPEDQPMLAFLWRDMEQDREPDVYVSTRHIFGATSSPTCANYALRQAGILGDDKYPGVSKVIEQQFYMDDFYASTDTEEGATALASQVCEVLADSGFHLTKWIANRPGIISQFPEDELSPKVKELRVKDSEVMPEDKVLGMVWDCERDEFAAKSRRDPVTKGTPRIILSNLASVYDPKGLLGPFLFLGKRIAHRAWIDVREWDKEVRPEIANQFIDWSVDVSLVTHEFRVPRWFGTKLGQEVELHVFTDASEEGFGAVAYLRFEILHDKPVARVTSDSAEVQNALTPGGEQCLGGASKISGEVRPQFGAVILASKNRLAPEKNMSLPRLELQGLVSGSRLLESLLPEILRVLNVKRIFLWTDSTVTLAWVSSETGKFVTFVANRVAEVQENLTRYENIPCQIRHVKGTQNPADLLTRGKTGKEFLALKEFWVHGPEWLMKTEDYWPSKMTFTLNEQDPLVQAEFKKVPSPEGEAEIVMVANASLERSLFEWIPAKVSSWARARTVAALVLTAVRKWRKRPCGHLHVAKEIVAEIVPPATRGARSGRVEARVRVYQEAYVDAERRMIRAAQKRYFRKEIRSLKSGKEKEVFKTGPLKQLQLEIDEHGILRVVSRLANLEDPTVSTNPVVLPGRSVLAKRLIEEEHQRLNHTSSKWVLGSLRGQFYVVPGLAVVKKVLRDCRYCRLIRPKPLDTPTAPYHPNRLDELKYPFAQCGMDHFGPFEVHPTRKSFKWEKRWILVFFCLTTRAVHMEVCERADVESLLLAFSRFTSLRHKPEHVYCDLGTSNVAASKELGNLLRDEAVTLRDRLFDRGVSFHFNLTATPHWGGSYERAIRTARKCMEPALRSVTKLSQEVFVTIVASCVRIINQRPIAWGEDNRPLTPQEVLQPYGQNRTLTSEPTTYRLYKKVQQAERAFWARWKSLYLTQLSDKAAWRSTRAQQLKPGDVVMVRKKTTDVFADVWTMARVSKVFPNPKDRLVREVEVSLPSGDKEITTIDRLALLESV